MNKLYKHVTFFLYFSASNRVMLGQENCLKNIATRLFEKHSKLLGGEKMEEAFVVIMCSKA